MPGVIVRPLRFIRWEDKPVYGLQSYTTHDDRFVIQYDDEPRAGRQPGRRWIVRLWGGSVGADHRRYWKSGLGDPECYFLTMEAAIAAIEEIFAT